MSLLRFSSRYLYFRKKRVRYLRAIKAHGAILLQPYLLIDHGEYLELPLGLLHVFLELRHRLGPLGQHILLDVGCEFYQPLTVIKIVGFAYQKTLLI